MSRTISDIYNILITEKETNSYLSELQPAIDSSQTLQRDLTSTSKVAIWRLIYYTIAVGTWIFEQLLDIHTAAIEARKLELIAGTNQWYASAALEWQEGDELTWNGNQYVYSIVDSTKRTVQYSSSVDGDNTVTIKVAKDDGSGAPEKLSAAQLTSFSSYMEQLVFAGINSIIVSTDEDLAKIYYTIQVNGLVIDATGESIANPGTFPVHDAIDAYLADLDFNGIFRVSELTDVIVGVEGVINPIATAVEGKAFAGTYEDIMANTLQDYTSVAGYMKVDPAFPLTTTMTYV